MVISRSGPPSSRRSDFMAAATKPPPSASSSPSPHAPSTAPTTASKRQPILSHHQQRQRGITHNHQPSLHDFSFPVLKTWGRQRLLRCAKVPPDHNEGGGLVSGAVSERRLAVAPAPQPPHKRKVKEDDGLEKIRTKLMGHLREAVGRMELKARHVPVPVSRRPGAALPATDESEEEDEEEVEEDEEYDEEYPDVAAPAPAPAPAAVSHPAQPPAPPEEEKPWKMRARRSTYKHTRTTDHPRRRRDSSPSPAGPSPHRGGSASGEANPGHPVPVPVSVPPCRSLRSRPSTPRSPEEEDPTVGEEQQRSVSQRRPRQQPPRLPQQQRRRKPFMVALSKDEIEEDVYALTGRRASRRPKKRPRTLRRQLDMLFPGYYLSEVTASLYEVREPPREA